MNTTQKGFSSFGWALALLCLPSALWPLALLVSPSFSQHSELTLFQADFFSVVFWIYPFILLLVALVLFQIHKKNPLLAKILLSLSFIVFYGLVGYIVSFF
ncbi:DUF5389 family protein [Otariodibacter oris]|uniref:Uncharacterized protein n=1 Tax=Otariodibacter oris TaxID=1032623 RepID=A0A420XFJ5_9PAST|nr:DUF5389 family protein [Otariodibacter oris]QGM81542.1 hypothetical protein A6A10_09050 [Otariodibacter oris]RKR71152.1 hypothetical protein DES31_1733 [Otariodibacter oris]